MTTKLQGVEADLAFMRSLAEGTGQGTPTGFGETYFAAGALYGSQILVQIADGLGWIHVPPVLMTLFLMAVTLAFFSVLGWVIWSNRKNAQGSMAARAVGAAFAAIGLANLVMVWVFGMAALERKSLTIWLLYVVVIFALQGAAWFLAFMVRRRLWLLAVSVGWFANGVVLGYLIDHLWLYSGAAAFGMFAWMMIPGAVVMGLARRAAV